MSTYPTAAESTVLSGMGQARKEFYREAFTPAPVTLSTAQQSVLHEYMQHFIQFTATAADTYRDFTDYLQLVRLSKGLHTARSTIDASRFHSAAKLLPDNRANWLMPTMLRWGSARGMLSLPALPKSFSSNLILVGENTIDLVISFHSGTGNATVNLAGDPDLLNRYHEEIKALVKNNAVLVLSTLTEFDRGSPKWSDETLQRKPLDRDRFKIFYPYLDDAENLIDDYMASSKAVLFMYGPPGTGKSSLLRDLICAGKEDANLVTNHLLFENPSFFTTAMKLPKQELLIFEDADAIVGPRNSGNGNPYMSPLLSMTSGITEKPRKLAVSTNITDLRKVDSALYRLGRTYRVLKHRAYTTNEANAVREYLGLPTVDFHQTKNFKEDMLTLAFVTNWEDDADVAERQASNLGFQ